MLTSRHVSIGFARCCVGLLFCSALAPGRSRAADAEDDFWRLGPRTETREPVDIRGGWGARAGAIFPLDAEVADYTAGARLGGFYRVALQRGWALEAEASAAWTQPESVDGDSCLLGLRGDALYTPWARGDHALALKAGGGMLYERSEVFDETNTSTVATVDAGLEYLWDARLSLHADYTWLIGSDNVEGLISVSIGYHF